MLLHISPKDGTPIYQQIVNQIKRLVAMGQLRPHEELPPVRTLAAQLLINPNTVARAYRELESAGVVNTRVGAGTYVAEGGSPLAHRERLRLLSERVDALLVESEHLNFTLDEVVELMRARLDALRGRKEVVHGQGD
ncbi:MAG: GntR family transcriptional regulator [Candidatus Hydrogenedens sp.]|nr:GntR family transcriptional regulator [Candidatus Hydrogenedentota bacterium]NLF58811.1 GntR family transcriptional regulator [Candidatus Hydrogenedens sp.]